MSSKGFSIFLYALWFCGLFPVHHPLDQITDAKPVSKKRFTARRLLIVAWSIAHIVYPLFYLLDIFLNADDSAAPDMSSRLSYAISWSICSLSQFVINVTIRTSSILNSGKLLQLLSMLRELRLATESAEVVASARGRDSVKKWEFHWLAWFLYAGQSVAVAYNIVNDVVTANSELKGYKLLFLPDSVTVRIAATHFCTLIITIPPLSLFHLVVILGSELIQIHGSICAELNACLFEGPIFICKNVCQNKTAQFQGQTQNQGTRLQERFSKLKDCFKIYEQLAGTVIFCVVCWIFGVVIIFCTSLTIEGLKRTDTVTYGASSLVFIYVVASFGEFMAGSIESGREAVADVLGRLSERKSEDEERASMVSHLQLVYFIDRSSCKH